MKNYKPTFNTIFTHSISGLIFSRSNWKPYKQRGQLDDEIIGLREGDLNKTN